MRHTVSTCEEGPWASVVSTGRDGQGAVQVDTESLTFDIGPGDVRDSRVASASGIVCAVDLVGDYGIVLSDFSAVGIQSTALGFCAVDVESESLNVVIALLAAQQGSSLSAAANSVFDSLEAGARGRYADQMAQQLLRDEEPG